jgi:peroxiredoxin
LRALQHVLLEITRLGAELVAVSPQTSDESLSTTEKNVLSFSVSSDIGSTTAKAFGIAYDVAEKLRPIYACSGHALPERNGDERWLLPIPPTYVIDTEGRIALAYVEADYRNRLEPAEILTALQSLPKKHRGEHRANASKRLLKCLPQHEADPGCRRRADRPIS